MRGSVAKALSLRSLQSVHALEACLKGQEEECLKRQESSGGVVEALAETHSASSSSKMTQATELASEDESMDAIV